MEDSIKAGFLSECFREINIALSETQIRQFMLYYEFLTEKNEVMNLTAITDYEDVVIKHFADSSILFSPTFLTALRELGLPENPFLIDVGTGAGFPGLPLSIVCPDCTSYLLDALQKRIGFLEELIGKLKLPNVCAVHGRAEEGVSFPLPKGFPERETQCLREYFDLTVSRAVSDLSVLLEYCLPYLRVGGIFAAYKSGNPEEELDRAGNALQILGGRVEKILHFQLPKSGDPRSIILIKKVRNTPAKYPRKAGKPQKSPL